MAKERKKAQRNAKQALEWKVLQKEREEKVTEHVRYIEQLEMEDENRKEIEKIEYMNKVKEVYMTEKEKMQARREQREKEKAELVEREKTYKEKLKEPPLYKKIEQRYHKKIELPKIESQQQALARLKIHFSPISWKDLDKHRKWYQENRRNHRFQSETCLLYTSPSPRDS